MSEKKSTNYMMAGKCHVVLALACGLTRVCACTDDKASSARSSAPLGTGRRVHYHYDELGRLVQAASPDGTGVQYSYDAVGNITAIRRLAANTLSVVDFTPRTGTVGSTVTVYGSGFDPNAADNAVAFNGTGAAVTSATETALIVRVPDGATSGKITVSNARGSATSTADYVVIATFSVPSIAAFTPQVGTRGTVVTVTGSNFQRNASANKVVIGTIARHLATVVKDATSPTSTQLKFSVPSSTASGTIEITTPFGRAASTSEFFAVPTTVDPAGVEFTGRLVVDGTALTVTTTANGKKAVLLFDAHADQRMHLRTQDGSFAASLTADVYAPDGTKIETLTLTNNGTVDFTKPLTLDGTYTVIINPMSSDKGSVQINVLADVAEPIALDSSTAVNLSSGQNAHVSFTAQAGTGYGLAVTGLSFTPDGGSMTVTLRKADGTSLISCSFTASGSCDLDLVNFASGGTYFLDFDPIGPSAASFNAVLSTDASGAVTVDAHAPTTVTIARAGQNARYSFSGMAGQLVTVVISGNTLDDGNPSTVNGTQVLVFKPSNSTTSISSGTFNTVAAGLTVDLTLPETGSYAIQINPTGLDSGSVDLQVTSYAVGTLALNGSTALNLGAGQNARYSFTAQAGTGYGLAITGLSFTPGGGSMTVTLRTADGTSLATCQFSASGSCDLDPTSFANTGTYLLDFDPAGLNAASFNAVLSTDASGSVTVDAAEPTVVTIARAGQNARYSFSGTTGQLVSVVVSGNTLADGDPTTPSSTQVLVFKPSDNVSAIANSTINAAVPGLTMDLALPETGRYTIAVKPTGLDSGTIDLQVKSYATGALALDGSTVINLSTGQNARYSFTAQASTGYGLAITGLSFTPGVGSPSMMVTLRKADSTSLASCQFSASGSCDLDPTNFANTGTYLLDFDPAGLDAASFNVVLSTDASGSVTADATEPTTVTIARPGQNARYSFSGTAGQHVSVVLSGYALDDGNPGTPSTAQVLVFKPSNNVNPLGSGIINAAAGTLTLNLTLPEAGSYTVAIKPTGLDSGTINLGVRHQ